jgi:hypothetical protein
VNGEALCVRHRHRSSSLEMSSGPFRYIFEVVIKVIRIHRLHWNLYDNMNYTSEESISKTTDATIENYRGARIMYWNESRREEGVDSLSPLERFCNQATGVSCHRLNVPRKKPLLSLGM